MTVKPDEITLDQTCFACPEQYDAYIGQDYVGYLRLRHGVFRVEDANGNVLKTYTPAGDGCFEEDEREQYLRKARKQIAKALNA